MYISFLEKTYANVMPQNNWKTTDMTDIRNAQLVQMLFFLGGQYGEGSLFSDSCVEICNMYLLGGRLS